MRQPVDRAQVACAEHRWGDARRLLSEVEPGQLEVDDLDRLATAAYLTGQDEDAFRHWAMAHHRCAADGAAHRAAHFGMKLAQGLSFKGDIGRCRGWVERTARLLGESGIDCVEQGYLEHASAMLHVFEAGDVAGARARFGAAAKIGARFAQRELVTLACIGEGRMLLYLGDVDEGLSLLDEAMVSIEAGELTPMATGDAYCTVIDACAELFDVRRCRAWTESFVRWCDTQQDLVLYRGHCFLHRAEVLTLQGDWAEALTEARRATERLASPVHPSALASAELLEGDLLRLGGDLGGAEAAYRRASEWGCDPQPGLALLRLAQGRPDAAVATIRRALAEAGDPTGKARLLGAAVEIGLHTGDTGGAADAAAEFRDVAAALGSPLLRARADAAAGAVLLAGGDPTGALVRLRSAFSGMQDLGVRHDAARIRTLIARACEALGDHDTAEMESTAARSELDALAAALPGHERPLPDGLTDREVQVLLLVAQGLTNREIAGELVVSEKTVSSHLSHIFTKLGVSSRAAATSYAYEHGLVTR